MRVAVLAVAAAVASGAVLLVLSSADLRRSGTSNVPAAGEVARLDTGQRRCQDLEVPDGAERIAVAGSSDSGATPSLVVTLSGGGRMLAVGRTRETAPDGWPLARLRPGPPPGAARVCVRNAGRDGVTLLGFSETFGVDYYGDRETWWRAVPDVARRFGFGKAGFVGPWAFWVALALVAAALIVGWRALSRSGPRS